MNVCVILCREAVVLTCIFVCAFRFAVTCVVCRKRRSASAIIDSISKSCWESDYSLVLVSLSPRFLLYRRLALKTVTSSVCLCLTLPDPHSSDAACSACSWGSSLIVYLTHAHPRSIGRSLVSCLTQWLSSFQSLFLPLTLASSQGQKVDCLLLS